MKQVYRGHEIVVTRQRCLGGWDRLYFSVYRVSDGYCCEEDGENSGEYIRDKVKQMRACIDRELASDDPWQERAGY